MPHLAGHAQRYLLGLPGHGMVALVRRQLPFCGPLGPPLQHAPRSARPGGVSVLAVRAGRAYAWAMTRKPCGCGKRAEALKSAMKQLAAGNVAQAGARLAFVGKTAMGDARIRLNGARRMAMGRTR